MTNDPRSALLQQFRILFESGTVAGLTDGQLLERFLTSRGEGGEVAFAALVARHGPMVLGVCRRALADPNDAADAFQATFLVLVKKARSVRVDDSLGRWLYGVSRRVAGRARIVAARRPTAEAGVLDSIEAASPDPDRFEIQAMLDEELARLPEAYRSAIVLCDLEGLTHEEAARDLLCPVGTIKSRLARGRKRLRERLERRGVAPSTLMLAPVVPPALARAAVRAATMAMGSGATAAGVVPAAVAALAQEVIKTMTGIKLKLAAAAVLSLGVVATGAGVLARGQERGEGPKVGGTVEAPHVLGEIPVVGEARRLIEVRGERVKLDGQAMTLEELTKSLKSLKSPTGAEAGPLATVHIRATPDQNYSDMVRVVEAVQAAGIREIRFETAASKVKPKFNEVATPSLQGRGRPFRPSRIEEKLDEVATPDAKDRPSAPPANPGRMVWPKAGVKGDPPREGQKVSMPDYVIEPPDMIVVEVLEALQGRPITGERLVKPDGKISLGFYGEVYVAGLTTAEVKAKVAQHLREYLDDEKLGLSRTDPKTGKVERVEPTRTDRIFVDITAYNSKTYYVQGDVGVPGRLPITGNETVLDAINYAGGFVPSASKERIRLVRPAPPGASGESVLPVDYSAIVDRGDVKTNYQIFPGDRLIVDRDPKVGRVADGSTKREADVEARLQAVEKKLDEVLKALDRLPKP